MQLRRCSSAAKARSSTSSSSSVHYVPGQLPYPGAGKALLEQFTTDLAVDYPDSGVNFGGVAHRRRSP